MPLPYFTDQQARDILDAVLQGTPRRALAKMYGVNLATIDRLVRGETYGHLHREPRPVRAPSNVPLSETEKARAVEVEKLAQEGRLAELISPLERDKVYAGLDRLVKAQEEFDRKKEKENG